MAAADISHWCHPILDLKVISSPQHSLGSTYWLATLTFLKPCPLASVISFLAFLSPHSLVILFQVFCWFLLFWLYFNLQNTQGLSLDFLFLQSSF